MPIMLYLCKIYIIIIILCLPSLGGEGNSVTGGAGLVFLVTVNGMAASTQQRIE